MSDPRKMQEMRAEQARCNKALITRYYEFDGPNSNGEAGVAIFRLEAGKIVEHWNVIQPIPDSLPHANTMV